MSPVLNLKSLPDELTKDHTVDSHSPTMHLVSLWTPTQTPRMPQQDGKKQKVSKKSGSRELSYCFHCLPHEHKRGPLEQLRIEIIWPTGWSDFEIILLLSPPPASNSLKTGWTIVPQRWHWKQENGHASVKRWCTFRTSKEVPKWARLMIIRWSMGQGNEIWN